MSRSRAPIFAGIAILAILVGAMSAVFLRGSSQPAINLANGTVLPSARPLPSFQLVRSDGQPYTQAQLQGRWSLMFFGFTNCPDICPTTLTLMAQVEKALSDLPSPPQIVFVSVDPRRDTPAQVSNYIKFFSPSFIGLTGEQAQIDQLTKAMGVPVAIHDLGNGAYSVDHAATLFLLDPQARMTAIFSPPHTVETLSDDLRMVISKLKS